MKKIALLAIGILLAPFFGNSQCTTSNATTCVCENSSSVNCDLLPDIKVGLPPLLASGQYGSIEYSQSGNGANNGRLRISVSSPNIGHGPLEVRTTNRYICGTDTITGTAPATCPTSGLPPKQLVVQRVYHKNGNSMSFTDRNAGSMTYHPSHGHMHVDDWGTYSLRQQTTDPDPLNWPIVGNGAKLAFCLMDYGSCSTYNGHCVDDNNNTLLNGNFPNYGLGGGNYGCSATTQGISSGYTDIYYQSLDGMWIDIPPGTCNGNYFIVVQLDPHNYFLEEDETNNMLVVPYTLTQQSPGAVATITPSSTTPQCAGQTVSLSANSGAGYTYLWSNGATTQNINVTTAGSYVVTISTPACGTTTSSAQTVSFTGSVPVTTGNSRCGEGTGTLSAVADSAAIIKWYSTSSGGGVLGTGGSFTTPSVTNTTIYYAEATTTTPGYSGYSTPNANTIGGGAYFTGSQYQIFDVLQSLNLSSVKVYASAATSTTVELRNSAGTLLNSQVANIPAGESRITLNWTIPAGTDYQLTRSGTASLYRNNAGVSYPYTIPSYLSIKNSSAGTAYYYFFYDWEINLPGQTCVSARVPATLTVNSAPSIAVSGVTDVCQGGSTTISATGATSYLWTGDNNGNYTTASINITPTVTTTYTVTGSNANGCTTSQDITVTVHDNPLVTASANTAICAGSSANLTSSGADTYVWSPATGLDVTNGSSVNASPASTVTYTVTGTNGAGCTASQNVTVAINQLPTVTLATFASVCKNDPSFALAGGTPTGGVYSGAGVSNGSFSPSIAGVGTHTITYDFTDNNGCASSATRTISVSNCNCVTPGTPGSLVGAAVVCAGSTVTYSVNYNSYVSSYNWVAPPNATISSGQGTHIVTVTFGTNYTTGTLCVAAANACGSSLPKCKVLKKNPSRTPGNIIGYNYGHCESLVDLSVAPVFGASSYDWTPPAGVTIVSGQGTNSVTLSTSAGFVSGLVCVTAFNGCENSISRCSYIYGAPGKPVISGPSAVCAGQTNLTYSIPAMYGATTYTWGVPSGSTIVSGQGTTSITVNYGSIAGKVAVTAKNACGNKGTSTLAVAINCRVAGVENLEVYPNPASTYVDVVFNSIDDSEASIQLMDIAGRVVYTSEVATIAGRNQLQLNLENLSKGIYMLNVNKNNIITRMKLVIE